MAAANTAGSSPGRWARQHGYLAQLSFFHLSDDRLGVAESSSSSCQGLSSESFGSDLCIPRILFCSIIHLEILWQLFCLIIGCQTALCYVTASMRLILLLLYHLTAQLRGPVKLYLYCGIGTLCVLYQYLLVSEYYVGDMINLKTFENNLN